MSVISVHYFDQKRRWIFSSSIGSSVPIKSFKSAGSAVLAQVLLFSRSEDKKETGNEIKIVHSGEESVNVWLLSIN